MTAKPFLPIDDQVRLLGQRGLAVDANTARILMCEGYYSIVNGYKDPFIDKSLSSEVNEDRYRSGASFSDLYSLFTFDKELRSLTFKFLILAEAKIKTAIAYTFSNVHRDPNDYYLQSSFCTQDEYAATGKDEARYAHEISNLTSILSRRALKSKSEFVAHYRNEYGSVPLWVLVNDLTFGNMEHFYNLMKPRERRAFCKMIVDATGKTGSKKSGFFSEKAAQLSIETLVKFRNVCAHDERLYCARVGGRKNINYIQMVWMLKRYLTEIEFRTFVEKLTALLSRYLKTYAIKHILDQIGFVELLQKSQDGTLFD